MRKRNWLKIFFAFLLFVSLLACNTKEKDHIEAEPVQEPISGIEDGFEWRLYEGKIIITKYKGTSLDVVIPSFIQGHPVTQIGNDAFKNSNYGTNKINSVTIPESVTKIGDNAFSYNNIASVTLPPSLTHIGRSAFHFNKLTSVTIPESVSEIDIHAFIYNPLNEIIIKSENLRSLPQYVFNLDIPGYLPPGTYVQKDEQWFFQDSDGALLLILSFFDKLITDKPGVLTDMLYDAVSRLDLAQFKFCISRGADLNSRMRGGQGNTPLAAIFGDPSWIIRERSSRRDYDLLNTTYRERAVEMAAILLEAGVLPQYWMLCYSYYRPDMVKMLLERGALTNTESSDYGDPPAHYQRPESLLFYYCQNLATQYNSGYELNPVIAESAALLLEYGEDANYRDIWGQTPLDLAMHKDIFTMEMAGLLYKHKPRPLPHEEYILLVGLNQQRVYRGVWGEWWGWRWLYFGNQDINRQDRCGFDAMVLEDIRKGFLNPELKDQHGKDIFDYAIETGTAGLVEGLLPYLLRSGRNIIAATGATAGTGLYFDAINTRNIPIAAVLSRAMNNKFIERDSRGNEYSLEYYAFDYDTVYHSAQKIPFHSLYQSGPGGNRRIGGEQDEVIFTANRFYTTNTRYGNDLSLHTVDGRVIDLDAAINEQWELYYRENGQEESDNSSYRGWNINAIFGNILHAHNSPWDYHATKHVLVDISGNRPTAYILRPEDRIIIEAMESWNDMRARDLIIDSGKAYLIRRSDEILVFDVEKNTLQYEKTVSWRDCRIPGWRGGEYCFVEDGIVTAFNFSTGLARPLGKRVQSPSYYSSDYIYEDADGGRFIIGTGGRTYPMPDERFGRIATFDQGYFYEDPDENFITICFFENGILKRKIVLSGCFHNGGYGSLSIHGNKIYQGLECLAFTIDLTSMRVSRAFNTDDTGSNSRIEVYMFPFGTDDVVYTVYLDGGK
jgi:ankyrin repeat protein